MKNDLKDILNEKELQNNPFRVPENYFDTLSERIMQRIDEEESKNLNAQKAKKIRFFQLPTMRWAAAVACVAVVGATSLFYVSNKNNATIASQVTDTATIHQASIEGDYVMDAMDYAMFDNQDIYQLLAEE